MPLHAGQQARAGAAARTHPSWPSWGSCCSSSALASSAKRCVCDRIWQPAGFSLLRQQSPVLCTWLRPGGLYSRYRCTLQGKLAWQRLSALLSTSMGGSSQQLGQIQHAYSGAWVATIVLGTLLAAFVIVVYLLRIGQRLRQDGRMGAGDCSCPLCLSHHVCLFACKVQ